MEADATLERADGVVELDPEAAVDVHLVLVIHPRHAEDDRALGLDHPLVDVGLDELRMALDGRFQGFHDLGHGLMELVLARVELLHLVDDVCND